MKRILINATHNEEVRVALCKGNHLYDFDLENRTREQKKSNIYKGHVTRVEPSLEAVFVEYGYQRQGFLPIREIASEYLSGNPREENIRKLIKEGDELIVQVEKEERGNKGAALSTYISLAGRYLVLMPNNPKGGGISRQISGKLREDMKRMLANLDLPKGMSVIVRTAGIGKTQEDLQHDLNHLLNIWNAIQEQNKKYPSPRLVHQEAGVVTRAVRDYLRDDIAEIWVDNEDAYVEAETFIKAVMPKQLDKLCKYTDHEPMFTRFNVERQIETAYQREVRLPSGGSIVIDQTEALVSIDINSAKSTKGADVSETAFHTNLEAADEIARQLRLRDMGGLVVIDFIDMNESKHQKEVEKRLVEATKYDRARVQFGEISRFGLMEMSRQRLRPSLEESTGYICPRCHGNGMIRDLRSLSLSIMRQIEQTALKERHGEVQAEVPTDIAAFLLNEKRESLVYLEQDSGTRITILPHAHLESPNFNLHFNHQGFAPSSYERVTDTQLQEHRELGYDVDWQTAEAERPEQQPTRQPRSPNSNNINGKNNATNNQALVNQSTTQHNNHSANNTHLASASQAQQPAAVAWLSNLFAQSPQAQIAPSVSSAEAAQAIEAIVNTGAPSRGAFGNINTPIATPVAQNANTKQSTNAPAQETNEETDTDKESRKSRGNRGRNKNDKRSERNASNNRRKKKDYNDTNKQDNDDNSTKRSSVNELHNNDGQKELPKREPNSKRESRGAIVRGEAKLVAATEDTKVNKPVSKTDDSVATAAKAENSPNRNNKEKTANPNEINLQVTEAEPTHKKAEVVHISLDDSKPAKTSSVETTKVETDDKRSLTEETTGNNKAEKVTEKETVIPVDAQVEKPILQTTNEAEDKADIASVNQNATTTVSDDIEDTVDDSTLTFNTEKLFTGRYIAAQKYGKASNDPRVVKAKMAENVATDKKEQANNTVSPTAIINNIQGSVGDFIHTHLAQATMRLAKDGVIKCFLAALNAHYETSQVAPAKKRKATTKAKNKAVANKEFSFVNYGYKALSPSYLKQFTKMTSASAIYNAEQGKTEVAPCAIGKRAANDPRGQHPDFIETEVVEKNTAETVSGTTTESEKASKEAADALSPAKAMAELLKLNVGNFVQRVLGQEGLDMLDAGHTETAFLQALRQPLEVLLSVASAVDNAENDSKGNSDSAHSNDTEVVTVPTVDTEEQPAQALTDAGKADEVGEQSAEILENTADDAVTEPNQETEKETVDESTKAETAIDSEATAKNTDEQDDARNADSTANKTTIESYKSMIENISEQLLPQTGLLNLTTPKVPKARSRKTSAVTKKSAQATQQKGEDDN